MTDAAKYGPASVPTHEMTHAGLNLIQQALTIYDRDLRLAVCNARFQEMFELPDRLVTPGADFADTVRFLAERGDYGEVADLGQFVGVRVETARAFKPHYMERTRANGRTISVEGSPLPEGGWVTVYTDITRARRQETLLRARSEELSGQLAEYSEELSATNRQLEATVTALEEAKRQITRIEARTRLTAEMMPAHIAHVGSDRRYTFSNKQLARIMPGAKPDIVGARIDEALDPDTYRAIAPRLDRAFAGVPSVFEFTDKASARRFRVAFTPDTVHGGVYILSMDITEETQTRAALQQTRRRETAAQMTSGMAHDFSNLLTIILGMQSKLQRMDLPDDASTLVSATMSAARRGGALLNRIADMTGRREHMPVPVDLGATLSELETLARSVLPEGVQFVVARQATPDRLLIDPGMLQDSLLNLVLNARDACAGAGRITLTVRTVQQTWIDFTVEDSGPGFSDRALTRAFEPFFTTKGGEGSGLGLVMVYDMTKLAGGRVSITNAPGGGAAVTMRLPLRPAERAPEGGLILLVEDSADLRSTVRDMLRDAGHSVIEATSVAEARALLAELSEIAALLSDIVLEGDETGIDLAADAPCPVFLMTSLPTADPRHAKAARLAPLLRKPFTAGQLHGFLTAASAPAEGTAP